MDEFGELRSALHAPATPDSWDALCGLVEAWDPRDLRERALPYAERQLERWPDAIRVAPRAWVEELFRGDAPAALAWVTRLDLSTRRPIEDEGAVLLSETSELEGLRILELGHHGIGARGVRALTQSMPWLHTLDLSTNQLHGDAALALSEASAWPDLRRLSVRHNQLDGRDLAALWRAPWMSGLRALELSSNENISPAGLEALSRRTQPLELRELAIDTCSIGWLGAKCLGDAAAMFPHLETLSLAHNALQHDTITALFRFVTWSSLRRLVLHSNRLGTTGVKILASANSLSGLEELALGNNSIGADGVHALEELASLPGLRRLELPSNELGDEGLRWLANYEALAGLEALDVGRNGLGLASAEAISKGPWRANVRELVLHHNRLEDAGVERLLRQEWPSLESLGLRLCHLTDESAERIMEASTLPSLRRVEMDFNDLSDDCKQRLDEFQRRLEMRSIEVGNKPQL